MLPQGNTSIIPSRKLLNFSLDLTATHHTPGDIESLKDCPLQVLNLAGSFNNPSKFTGKYDEVVKVLPQGNHKNLSKNFENRNIPGPLGAQNLSNKS